jgi:GH18 family chitinase
MRFPGKSFSCSVAAAVLATLHLACGASTSPTPPTGPTSTPTPEPAPPPAPAGFKVVGYVPSYTGGATAAQFDMVTHINYAFLNPNDGITAAEIPNPGLLASTVTAAHARGVQVLLAVGGWTEQNNQGFEFYSQSASGANFFANSMMAIVTQFGLDGIDIDWEWPSATDGTDQMYVRLMDAVCAKMHANGKQCSTAVVAAGQGVSGISSATFPYVDWFNLMAYDMGAGAGHSSYGGAAAALDSWGGRGLPASKMILGVPFYGRGSNFAEAMTYRDIVAADPDAPQKDISNGMHYNGLATMKRKADLALVKGGGVMIWELSQDTSDATSLLAAIHSRVSN